MRDRLLRVRMRDFTALPPSSPLATATTNFLHHRLYPLIVAPTPAPPSPSLSLSLSLAPLFRHILYHDFSHRLFFLRTEMMTSGRGYLLRETRWCVERAIDGEWEGRGGEGRRERGRRKKTMRYQWSKNEMKGEARARV